MALLSGQRCPNGEHTRAHAHSHARSAQTFIPIVSYRMASILAYALDTHTHESGIPYDCVISKTENTGILEQKLSLSLFVSLCCF